MNGKLRAMWLPCKSLLACINVNPNQITMLVLLPAILVGYITMVFLFKKTIRKKVVATD